MRERRRGIRRGFHTDAVMPVGRQADLRGSDEVEGRASDEQASCRVKAEFREGESIRAMIGLVEAGALGRDHAGELDPDLGDGNAAEPLGAVGDDAQGNR